jgi:hypothetical protein
MYNGPLNCLIRLSTVRLATRDLRTVANTYEQYQKAGEPLGVVEMELYANDRKHVVFRTAEFYFRLRGKAKTSESRYLFAPLHAFIPAVRAICKKKDDDEEQTDDVVTITIGQSTANQFLMFFRVKGRRTRVIDLGGNVGNIAPFNTQLAHGLPTTEIVPKPDTTTGQIAKFKADRDALRKLMRKAVRKVGKPQMARFDLSRKKKVRVSAYQGTTGGKLNAHAPKYYTSFLDSILGYQTGSAKEFFNKLFNAQLYLYVGIFGALEVYIHTSNMQQIPSKWLSLCNLLSKNLSPFGLPNAPMSAESSSYGNDSLVKGLTIGLIHNILPLSEDFDYLNRYAESIGLLTKDAVQMIVQKSVDEMDLLADDDFEILDVAEALEEAATMCQEQTDLLRTMRIAFDKMIDRITDGVIDDQRMGQWLLQFFSHYMQPPETNEKWTVEHMYAFDEFRIAYLDLATDVPGNLLRIDQNFESSDTSNEARYIREDIINENDKVYDRYLSNRENIYRTRSLVNNFSFAEIQAGILALNFDDATLKKLEIQVLNTGEFVNMYSSPDYHDNMESLVRMLVWNELVANSLVLVPIPAVSTPPNYELFLIKLSEFLVPFGKIITGPDARFVGVEDARISAEQMEQLWRTPGQESLKIFVDRFTIDLIDVLVRNNGPAFLGIVYGDYDQVFGRISRAVCAAVLLSDRESFDFERKMTVKTFAVDVTNRMIEWLSVYRDGVSLEDVKQRVHFLYSEEAGMVWESSDFNTQLEWDRRFVSVALDKFVAQAPIQQIPMSSKDLLPIGTGFDVESQEPTIQIPITKTDLLPITKFIDQSPIGEEIDIESRLPIQSQPPIDEEIDIESQLPIQSQPPIDEEIDIESQLPITTNIDAPKIPPRKKGVHWKSTLNSYRIIPSAQPDDIPIFGNVPSSHTYAQPPQQQQQQPQPINVPAAVLRVGSLELEDKRKKFTTEYYLPQFDASAQMIMLATQSKLLPETCKVIFTNLHMFVEYRQPTLTAIARFACALHKL